MAHAAPITLPDGIHPLYNENRLKLGIFGTNVSNGCAISTAPTSFVPTFEHNLEIARKAERYGIEALVPVGRWKGFGGKTDFNGNCMEVYTWAAALAARTEKIVLFATSHVPTVHPLLAAKQATTVDQISGGRFGINIVCGWFSDEMDMFGGEQMPHDDRYRYASEWITVAKQLWAEDGFSFKGKFFNIKDAYMQPKSVQRPRPVLMNAGVSEAGRDFAAREMDFSFGIATSLEDGAASIADMKRRAAGYGRDIGIISNAVVVCRETEQEARRAYDHLVACGDDEAVDHLIDVFGVQSQSMPAAAFAALRERLIAGWGGFPLVGTPEQVVEGMQRIADIGVDVLLLSWLDYNEELTFFGERVMPLMVQAGLRQGG